MQIKYQVVTFDAADLASESAFWAGVLGGDVDVDGDWHMVIVDGEPRVGVPVLTLPQRIATCRLSGPAGALIRLWK